MLVAARAVRREPRVVGELGSSHRLAQPDEHAVGVGGDDDLGAVARRVHVRRRDTGQHAARPRAHDAAELVVGHRRLHQRGDRLVDRDVDLLPDAGRARATSSADSVPITPNTDASASPRLMPARDGGRSGLPVV